MDIVCKHQYCYYLAWRNPVCAGQTGAVYQDKIIPVYAGHLLGEKFFLKIKSGFLYSCRFAEYFSAYGIEQSFSKHIIAVCKHLADNFIH